MTTHSPEPTVAQSVVAEVRGNRRYARAMMDDPMFAATISTVDNFPDDAIRALLDGLVEFVQYAERLRAELQSCKETSGRPQKYSIEGLQSGNPDA